VQHRQTSTLPKPSLSVCWMVLRADPRLFKAVYNLNHDTLVSMYLLSQDGTCAVKGAELKVR
jgi:hypothetical protein